MLDDPTATAASLLTRSGDGEDSSDGLGTGSEDDEDEDEKNKVGKGEKTWWDRGVKLITGVAPGAVIKNDSPTARLKLLLVSPFFFPFLHPLLRKKKKTRLMERDENRFHPF